MADQSDVETALVNAIEAVRVAQGAAWDVFRGWPEADALSRALAAGQITVTVTPRIGFARDTARYPSEEYDLPSVAPTLTVSVAGNVATFAGTCSTDQLAGVKVQSGNVTAYRCGPGDTPSVVAAALATGCGGTAVGAVLTVPGLVSATTERDVTTLRPTRQQEMGFAVNVWAPDPITRDTVAGAVDEALSDQDFLILADGSAGRLKWAGSRSTDRAQNDNLYQRDLYYSVDFSTTITATRTPILFPNVSIAPGVPVGVTASTP